MKYVFTPFTAKPESLSRSDCIVAQLGYGDYLSDNGYSYYAYNTFVHDAYYKWDYITIDDLSDKSTKLPYVPGDEIYFVLGCDLDKFKETVLKEDGNNFNFVEKSEFYKWALYNGSLRLKEIADNYFKNTKSSYMQFKNLNVGDIFKLINGELLYIKVGQWYSVVLTGDERGYSDIFNPATNVEIVRNAVITDQDSGDLSEAYKKRLYKEIEYIIRKVIFKKPATTIIWADGTKTVVKCQKNKNGKYEKYDKEKGLALCFMKKALGNKYDYYDIVKNIIERFG